MEHIESLADMDWSSLMSGMMYTNEQAEAEFMAQLLSNFPVSAHQETSNYHNLESYTSLDADFFSTSSALFNMSAADSCCSQHLSSSTSQGSSSSTSHHHPQDTSMDLHSYSLPPLVSKEEGPISTGLSAGKDTLLVKKKSEQHKHQHITAAGDNEGKPSKGPKKRSRVTGGEATKAKKNVMPKKGGKKQKGAKMEEESNVVKSDAGAAINGCSEDESNVNGSAADEMMPLALAQGGEAIPTTTTTSTSSTTVSLKGDPALNLNGKTRASRGAATDPQSLYARKRRERINERLKVLQTLVPNGTKVDISTMLEEAVQYVKFLQLQIKLLSSDDHWMYAPIAYNGMNIGLDLKIPQHI
ncbi:unnamed protein product [Linum trigynum]|uniref:BHLH domain-containing protein n=2 Tax=Linum trigynum TaxID=586398 RepID=A0AAV2E0K7_9ROSI